MMTVKTVLDAAHRAKVDEGSVRLFVWETFPHRRGRFESMNQDQCLKCIEFIEEMRTFQCRTFGELKKIKGLC